MNYFLRTESDADFSLKLSKKNKINISLNLALGLFIKEELIPNIVYYTRTSNSKVTKNQIKNSDFILNVSGGYLISDKVKSIIQTFFPNECQFIEAEIDCGGVIVKGFHSINIYNKVPCYDLDLSEYEYLESFDSYDFDRIVLKKTLLEEYGLVYNIVRSNEDNKVVVSDKFKKIMEENNIRSVVYEEEFKLDF